MSTTTRRSPSWSGTTISSRTWAQPRASCPARFPACTTACSHLSARPGSPTGGDVFRLGEFQESLVRALAADAGLLHAAERRRRVRHDAAVEADHPGLECLADPQPAAQITGVD